MAYDTVKSLRRGSLVERAGGVHLWFTRLSRREQIGMVTILSLWILLILPAAFLNHFFPLDQGGLFEVGAAFPAGPVDDGAKDALHFMINPYLGKGRYFPVYWFFHDVLLFRLFSTHTAGYYLVQSVLFLVSALIIGRILAKITPGASVMVWFGVAIFLSSPNAETLYTLFKAEPLILFFMGVIFALFYFESSESRNRSIFRYLTIAVLFTLSIWSKETSLALFVVPVTGIVAAAFLRRYGSLTDCCKVEVRRYLQLLFALGLGFGLSRVPYVIFARDAGRLNATYTTFAVSPKLVVDNLYFYVSQQPDVIGIGIVASLCIIFLMKRFLSHAEFLESRTISGFVFVVTMLALAWSYTAALMIWRWPMAYYLFIPSLLFRFAAAYGLFYVIEWRLVRKWRWMLLGGTGAALLAYSVVYLWYSAGSQVAYSRMYTEALRQYVSMSGPNDSLFFESYPFYAEQVGATAWILKLAFHAFRHIQGMGDLVNPALITSDMRSLLSVSDAYLKANEKNWPKKGDYVMVVTGRDLGSWQVRGVSPFYSDGSDLQRDGEYDMELVRANGLYFPAFFVNVWTHKPSIQPLYNGYQIYRVRSGPRFTWLGEFPDGWIGRQARLTLYPEFVSKVVVYISTSKYDPVNSVTVSERGRLVRKEILREGIEQAIELKAGTGREPTVFQFEVASTFSPKRLHMNDDIRELGARIRLEPFGPSGRLR
ncbi:MAG: hypothetical protein JO323_02900 [Acidobacteriia bacterium]|nr:hypothetical protein [Terriglobia bacterium]